MQQALNNMASNHQHSYDFGSGIHVEQGDNISKCIYIYKGCTMMIIIIILHAVCNVWTIDLISVCIGDKPNDERKKNDK